MTRAAGSSGAEGAGEAEGGSMRDRARKARNAIVFALGPNLYALELRWVREVVTLPYVTPVPTAPRGVLGAVNVRGAIVPVIDVEVLERARSPDRRARAGEGAILLEVGDASCALRIDKVEEVTTLKTGARGERCVDARGREIALVDPESLASRLAAKDPGAGGAHVG